VELHRIEVARFIRDNGKGGTGGGAANPESRWNPGDMIAVGHPDLFLALGKPSIEER